MFRRKKTDASGKVVEKKTDTIAEELSNSKRWLFKKKTKVNNQSTPSLNLDTLPMNHIRSATEPAKIDLSQKITLKGSSSMDAVKKSFQRHFPRLYFTGEVVIKSFTCALEKDIIMQGKLFLTPRYACFYSNVFNRNFALEIPFAQVSKVEKKNTIGMIPNAINIWALDQVHFFLSFAKRDLAFELIIEFWENQKILDTDLNANFEALNMPLDDEMFLMNDGNGFKTTSVPNIMPLIMMDKNADSAASSPRPETIIETHVAYGAPVDGEVDNFKPDASFSRRGNSPRGSLSFSNASCLGPGAPLSWEMLEIILDLDFVNVFAQLITDSSNSWTQIHKICRTNGLFIGNWKQDRDLISRNLIYSPAIQMAQSTSTVMFMEKQVFKKYSTYANLESSIRLQNSTYTDAVVIKILYTAATNTLNKSRLTISAQVDYHKKNISSRTHLESSILDWLILFHSCFLSHIKEKFNTTGYQDNSSDHYSKSPVKENMESLFEPPAKPRQRDYRFWIALGIIISLVLAIVFKLRLQIEDGQDESLAYQLIKAKKKLLEHEIHIKDLWAKLKNQKEDRGRETILL